MNELALFAGAGGGILGGKLLGWRTVCAVEWEAYPASVLCARQNDGLLPPFPIWDDVQTFDGKPWAGIVDVVSGGFPCQDISTAGGGGEGITGARSSMWKHMARIIHEIRPKFVFVENSPNLTSRGLGVVLGDLATMGFDAKWGVLGAADVGAPHQRDRIWIFANNISDTNCESYAQRGIDHAVSETGGHGSVDKNGGGENVGGIIEPTKNETLETEIRATIGNKDWWIYESGFPRVVDGVAARVDRFKAIGNGQVPLCAATAWRILSEQ